MKIYSKQMKKIILRRIIKTFADECVERLLVNNPKLFILKKDSENDNT